MNNYIIFKYFADCHSTFLGLPSWHDRLQHEPKNYQGVPTCEIKNFKLGDIWLIGLSILESVIRIAAVVSVIMIIFGGFKFIISQGNPEAIQGARSTILNAIIGLVIAVSAQAIIAVVEGILT